MKKSTERNILVAFLLNLSFSVIEIVGGLFTNSMAILSDAIHDFGDAFSIGVSYFLEKKSKHKPNAIYTYGYLRYSVLGAFITTTILTLGSLVVLIGAITRIIYPEPIHYEGMIGLSIIGIIINFLAAYTTKEGDSLNQKAVNLHMLEDVLGWVVVFIGSILMKFTDITYIDSIMSIGIALYLLKHAVGNLKNILNLFLAKVPSDIHLEEVRDKVLKISGVKDVHHIHIWSLDGVHNYLTMHVVVSKEKDLKVKKQIKEALATLNITHSTLELELPSEQCEEENCDVKTSSVTHHHHHHE